MKKFPLPREALVKWGFIVFSIFFIAFTFFLNSNNSSLRSKIQDLRSSIVPQEVQAAVGTLDITGSVISLYLPGGGIINTSGNIGVGTTNPTQKLDLSTGGLAFAGIKSFYGNGIGSTAPLYLEMGIGSTGAPGGAGSPLVMRWDGATNKLIFQNDGSNSYIWTLSGKKLIFATNVNSESHVPRAYDDNAGMVAIDTSGQLGVGTTSPGARLDVSGTARATSLYAYGSTGTDILRIQPGDDNNSGWAAITVGNAAWNSYPFIVTKAGAVTAAGQISGNSLKPGSSVGALTQNWFEWGLDDNSTGTGIDMHGGSTYSDYTFRLYRVGGDNGALWFENRGTGDMNISQPEAGKMNLRTSGANRMIIQSDGKIAVNQASADNTFDILGTLQVCGAASCNQANAIQVGNDAWLRDIDTANTFGVYGSSSGSWGYIKTYITDPSSRKQKYDITPLSFENKTKLLADLDKIELKLFHLNSEPATTEKHIGVIAEESPSIILARNDSSGVSQYDYSSLAIFGVKEALSQIKQLQIQLNSQSETLKKTETFINGISDFAAKLQAGVIEAKKLIINGVDILEKLNVLSKKVDQQQEEINELQKQILKLKNK